MHEIGAVRGPVRGVWRYIYIYENSKLKTKPYMLCRRSEQFVAQFVACGVETRSLWLP